MSFLNWSDLTIAYLSCCIREAKQLNEEELHIIEIRPDCSLARIFGVTVIILFAQNYT